MEEKEMWLSMDLAKELEGKKVTLRWMESSLSATFVMPKIKWCDKRNRFMISAIQDNGAAFFSYFNGEFFSVADDWNDAYVVKVWDE